MTQDSLVYAQETTAGQQAADVESLSTQSDGETAQPYWSAARAQVRLTEEQTQSLTRIAIPSGTESGVIPGPDWAVMIGLEVHDAFWDNTSHGEARAYLPHGDTMEEVSVRGRNGIRNTRVRLQDDVLQIESNGNSPIDARDLAAVIASSAGADTEPVDLPETWLQIDRSRDATTTYAWPEGQHVHDAQTFDAALRQLDPNLAEAVAKLRNQADLTPQNISRIENRLTRSLSITQGTAHSNYDSPLATFAAAAILQIRELATARRAAVNDNQVAAQPEQTNEPAPTKTVASPQANEPANLHNPSRAELNDGPPDAGNRGTDEPRSLSGAPTDREVQIRQVADMLLSRHMDQVENELELLKARISGTFRVLDQAPVTQPHQEYKRWETGLQRLDSAYQAVSRYAHALAATPEWQQIAAIWQSLQRLVQHIRDDVARFGAPIVHGFEDRLKRIVAASATMIGDLSVLAGTALPQPTSGQQRIDSTPIHEVVHALSATGHGVGAALSRAPAAERDSQLLAPEVTNRPGPDRATLSYVRAGEPAATGPPKDRRTLPADSNTRARLATAPAPPRMQPQPRPRTR